MREVIDTARAATSALTRNFCTPVACALIAGCASTNQPIFSDTSIEPISDAPSLTEALAPLVDQMGDKGFYITRTQTRERQVMPTLMAPVNPDDPESEEIHRTQQFGNFYRRLVVESDDGFSVVNSESEGNETAARIECTRNSSGFGRFLGSLIGYKRDTLATLNVTVTSVARTNGEPNTFVEDFPVLFVKRGRNDCTYKLYTDSLTPYISAAANDELRLRFSVRHTDARRVDFTGLSSVFTILQSQLPKSGFVRTANELSASGINEAVNFFLKDWNTDTNLERTLPMDLGGGPNAPFDQVVISFGLPQNVHSFEEISFANAPAFTFKLQYIPSMFMGCEGELDIARCTDSIDDETRVLEKNYGGKTLSAIAGTSPDPTLPSLTAKLSTTRELGDTSEKRRALENICDELKSRFEPNKGMNKIDRLIFRYTMLSLFSDYLRDAELATISACFTTEDRALLRSLGPTDLNPRFAFPEFVLAADDRIKENLDNLSQRLRDGLEAKSALFGTSGVLDIRLDLFLAGADGQDLRPGSRRGAEAAQLLDSIKFRGGAHCRLEGVVPGPGPEDSRYTDRLFGFLHRVRDEVDGGFSSRRGEGESRHMYVPFVAELTDNALISDLRIKRLVIPSSMREHYDLLNRSMPEDPWSEACMASLIQEELVALKDTMGANSN